MIVVPLWGRKDLVLTKRLSPPQRSLSFCLDRVCWQFVRWGLGTKNARGERFEGERKSRSRRPGSTLSLLFSSRPPLEPSAEERGWRLLHIRQSMAHLSFHLQMLDFFLSYLDSDAKLLNSVPDGQFPNYL